MTPSQELASLGRGPRWREALEQVDAMLAYGPAPNAHVSTTAISIAGRNGQVPPPGPAESLRRACASACVPDLRLLHPALHRRIVRRSCLDVYSSGSLRADPRTRRTPRSFRLMAEWVVGGAPSIHLAARPVVQNFSCSPALPGAAWRCCPRW